MGNRLKAEQLAVRVRKAAKGAELTFRELSRLTGIPYSTLNRRLDVAPEKFTLDEIDKIAAACEVEPELLLVGADTSLKVAS